MLRGFNRPYYLYQNLVLSYKYKYKDGESIFLLGLIVMGEFIYNSGTGF
jgi:hypothetical protein